LIFPLSRKHDTLTIERNRWVGRSREVRNKPMPAVSIPQEDVRSGRKAIVAMHPGEGFIAWSDCVEE
jgi:hypothetical protein